MITTTQAVNFTCRMCGCCCKRSWKVPLDPAFYQRIIRESSQDAYIKANFHYKTGQNGLPYFDSFFRSRQIIEDSGLLTDEKNKAEMTHKLLSNLPLYLTSDHPGMQSAANLIMNNASCGFMQADKRCYLHAVYGSDFLGDVCYSYPRLYYKTIRGIERGLSGSCPAAVKLLTEDLTIIRTYDGKDAFRPQKIRELACHPLYFDQEETIINQIDAGQDRPFSELFERLIVCCNCYSVPAFDILNNAYTQKTHAIINYLYSKKSSIDVFPFFVTEELLGKIECGELERFNLLENTQYHDFENKNRIILNNYFKNYFFTKSFYLYRESITDSILMALLLYRIIRFSITAGFFSAPMMPDTNVLLNLICQIEQNLLHNSKRSREILIDIFDWY